MKICDYWRKVQIQIQSGSYRVVILVPLSQQWELFCVEALSKTAGFLTPSGITAAFVYILQAKIYHAPNSPASDIICLLRYSFMQLFPVLHLQAMMIQCLSAVLLCLYATNAAVAQPGFSLAPLQFKVFYKGDDFIQRPEKDIVLEWWNKKENTWQKALVQNGAFVTGSIDLDRHPADIKIYRKNFFDTMFINTSHSLHHIPFQPGHFVFNRHTAPLANMETFAGVYIINQQWKYFNLTATDTLPLLPQHRYVYMDKELYPYGMETGNEPGVQYKGFQKSEHIKATDEDGYELYMELGELYYAPALSSSVYCIGYLDDLHKEEKDYRPWLLESKDGCRSWTIRFPMQETDAQLAGISEKGFTFLREAETVFFVTYDVFGNIVDSMATEEPCNFGNNIFLPCDKDTKFSGMQPVETSSPLMANNSMPHLFHRRFTSDGLHFISLESLPFHPNEISRTGINGGEEKILQLNAGDTYAYLTIRKRTLVLVSYDYTLVSKDFGNTWMYYRNGLLNGGNWNFIWLNDNTLVNVTQEYAAVINIQ